MLAASVAAARKPTISAAESRVFHAINGLPDFLFPVLWLPMQLGNLVVGTIAGLVVAVVDGDLAVAIGVVLAMLLKLVTERIVRKEMADYLAVRQRPGTSQVGAILRGGDVPVVGSELPVRARHPRRRRGHRRRTGPSRRLVVGAASLLTLLVMVGRVYVGAHNPLDVTAGLGAGLVLGGVLAAFVE